VKVKGKWGYIDREGDFAIPPSFSAAKTFRDGFAIARRVNDSFVLDAAGLSSFERNGE